MESAEDDVICQPYQQQPASPVLGSKHKRATNNRDKAHEANPGGIRVQPTEFTGMINETDHSSCDEEPADDRNRERTGDGCQIHAQILKAYGAQFVAISQMDESLGGFNTHFAASPGSHDFVVLAPDPFAILALVGKQ